jgi:tetratricopeptide (TPR) repeat protein
LASSLLVGTKSDAGQTVDTNPVVGRAIDHLRNLEYGVAKQQLRAWLDSDPTDLYAWNYLAVATLYEEMLKRGVLESKVYGEGGDIFKGSNEVVTPTFEAELFSILDKSQQLAEARLKSNANDKDAMYWMGVGHGTRATYHFALRQQYISALREATTAYKYHEHLLKIDPDFVDCYFDSRNQQLCRGESSLVCESYGESYRQTWQSRRRVAAGQNCYRKGPVCTRGCEVDACRAL